MPMPRKLLLCCALLTLTAAFLPGTSLAGSKQLIDSKDYKDKDFKKCAIEDYADMVEGDDVEWLWANPAQKLADYKLKVGKVENKSEIRSKSMVESVKNTFKDTFADLETKGAAGTLTADLCIYSAENMNMAKAWIPFVGGNQMQAGIGIEMVLRDQHDKVVAKFRHFAREGGQIEAATQEVVGDLMKYVAKH
jgi:DNA-binding protein Fis